MVAQQKSGHLEGDMLRWTYLTKGVGIIKEGILKKTTLLNLFYAQKN